MEWRKKELFIPYFCFKPDVVLKLYSNLRVFIYSLSSSRSVDYNAEYDNLEIRARDEEEKYFDED